jgi:hypothetical protein
VRGSCCVNDPRARQGTIGECRALVCEHEHDGRCEKINVFNKPPTRAHGSCILIDVAYVDSVSNIVGTTNENKQQALGKEPRIELSPNIQSKDDIENPSQIYLEVF